jgi:hypothetical protein
MPWNGLLRDGNSQAPQTDNEREYDSHASGISSGSRFIPAEQRMALPNCDGNTGLRVAGANR